MILMIVGLFKWANRHVDDSLILWLGQFLAVIILVVIYFLFMVKAKGVPVFEYSLKPTEINPVLIAGFLQAISSFKDQIMKPGKEIQTGRWELDYENFKISRFDGKQTFLAILSEKTLSEITKQNVNNLLLEFEEIYKTNLEKFKGIVSEFKAPNGPPSNNAQTASGSQLVRITA